MINKLYVLVRKDLPESYRAVQAGHAVAEWLLCDQRWQNETLVYLGVENENELINWTEKLDFNDIKYIKFREPDIGNQLTAVAALGADKIFKKIKLL